MRELTGLTYVQKLPVPVPNGYADKLTEKLYMYRTNEILENHWRNIN
jgi:hypothetical protein